MVGGTSEGVDIRCHGRNFLSGLNRFAIVISMERPKGNEAIVE